MELDNGRAILRFTEATTQRAVRILPIAHNSEELNSKGIRRNGDRGGDSSGRAAVWRRVHVDVDVLRTPILAERGPPSHARRATGAARAPLAVAEEILAAVRAEVDPEQTTYQ